MASITITRGEAPTLSLNASTNGSTGFNLTGASMQTKFLKRGKKEELVIANGAHTIDGDQSTNTGDFTVDLTAAQTKLLEQGEGLSFVSIATISSKDYFFHADAKLVVKPEFLTEQ